MERRCLHSPVYLLRLGTLPAMTRFHVQQAGDTLREGLFLNRTRPALRRRNLLPALLNARAPGNAAYADLGGWSPAVRLMGFSLAHRALDDLPS